MTSTNSIGVMRTIGNYYGTCSDFTGDDGKAIMSGVASANSDVFTQQSDMPCSQPARLYCFGIDHQAQVSVTPAVGRHAFD